MDNAAEQSTVFDTDQQYLGNVYAKALIGVGQSGGKTAALLGELDSLVNDVLPRIPKLQQTLESPRVAFEGKVQLLDRALGGKASHEFLNFLKVLCRNNRFDCVTAVNRAARKIHNEAEGRIEATLVTAQEVGDDVKSRVKEQLSNMLGKQIELASEIDESIIGGLVVRVGDTVFDGSLANQFDQVRRSAVNRANQEIRTAIDRFAVDA